jgi:hypothetical protein
MIVPLDEHDVGAGPRRGDGGSGAGRSAAGHQHVAIAEHRHPLRRFGDGRVRPLAALGEPPGAEHLGLEEQPPVIRRFPCGHSPAPSLTGALPYDRHSPDNPPVSRPGSRL